MSDIRKEFSDTIYPRMVIRSQAETIELQDKEIERLNNIIDEIEKDLIEYFKREYPDRKLEDYNLENCTYDYALVILGRLQELKGVDINKNNNTNSYQKCICEKVDE